MTTKMKDIIYGINLFGSILAGFFILSLILSLQDFIILELIRIIGLVLCSAIIMVMIYKFGISNNKTLSTIYIVDFILFVVFTLNPQ